MNTGARLMLLTMTFCLVAVSSSRAAQPDAQPNVVLIVADDLGYGDVGFNGGTEIRTPNIDALAKTGVIFTSGYAASALCSPARAGLMTGRYQERYGHENNPPEGTSVGLPLKEVTMADVLRGSGYATALVGKWHLGTAPAYRPLKRGFDYFYGFLHSTSNYLAPVVMYRNDSTAVATEYLTTQFADEAVEYIHGHRSQPFFLYLAFNAVHVPLQAPPRYVQRYASIANANRRTYAGMVSALDDAVGEVAAALKDAGIDRKTLLFFMSDNGGAVWKGAHNTPLRGTKGQVYEGGIRVPMFVRWPNGLPGGIKYRKPVISLDVLPTAAAAVGARTPHNLDGVNLLPYLRGQSRGAPHDALFWRLGGGTSEERSAALVGETKLAHHPQRQPVVVDLTEDIGERKNIATPTLLSRLGADYRQWESQMVRPLW